MTSSVPSSRVSTHDSGRRYRLPTTCVMLSSLNTNEGRWGAAAIKVTGAQDICLRTHHEFFDRPANFFVLVDTKSVISNDDRLRRCRRHRGHRRLRRDSRRLRPGPLPAWASASAPWLREIRRGSLSRRSMKSSSSSLPSALLVDIGDKQMARIGGDDLDLIVGVASVPRPRRGSIGNRRGYRRELCIARNDDLSYASGEEITEDDGR